MTAVAEPTTRRINKTNLAYAEHHFGQALSSLSRAQEMMSEMAANSGRSGEIAKESWNSGNSAEHHLRDSINHIDELNEELRAFFG